MTFFDNPAAVLKRSDDPVELQLAAAQLARSDRDEDLQLLAQLLGNNAFLLRLNSNAEYGRDPDRLRLRDILFVLARNPSVSALTTLFQLLEDEIFNQESSRVDLLIRTLALLVPAPQEAVSYWDRHCQPRDGFDNETIANLISNGSEPALTLLARKFIDPAHADIDKIDWMRCHVLSNRHRAAILRCCAGLLRGALPQRLRLPLIEVLFDYQPALWYPPHGEYDSPAWQAYDMAARCELRALADDILQSVELDQLHRAMIMRTLAQLNLPDD